MVVVETVGDVGTDIMAFSAVCSNPIVFVIAYDCQRKVDDGEKKKGSVRQATDHSFQKTLLGHLLDMIMVMSVAVSECSGTEECSAFPFFLISVIFVAAEEHAGVCGKL